MAGQRTQPRADQATAADIRTDSDQLGHREAHQLREEDAQHSNATVAAADDEIAEIDQLLSEADEAHDNLEALLDEIDAEIATGETIDARAYKQLGGE